MDGTWFDSNTDELINMEKMWRPGQPNGGNLQECALYHGEDGNYYDDQCSYKSCFVCSWDKRPVFTLRGLCINSNIDIEYVMLPQYTYDGTIIFFGFEKTNIIFSQEMNSWLIVEDSIDDLLETLNTTKPSKIVGTLTLDKMNNRVPIGKQFWNLTENCKTIQSLKLTGVSLSLLKVLILFLYSNPESPE